MGTWKALLTAIGVVSGIAVLAIVIRPPKIDVLLKYNPPSVYIPTLTVIFAFFIIAMWRGLRK
jgi:hypothetical protein